MATSSPSGSGNDSDQDFDPSAEMLVNEFDDEHTLDEEEALVAEDTKHEIDELEKEGNMPIEELIALYGYGDKQTSSPDDDSSQDPSLASKSRPIQFLSAPAGSSVPPNMFAPSDSEEDSDSDQSNYEGDWRRTIQVGSDYQASVPQGLAHYPEKSTIGANDILLWKPSPTLKNSQINDYLIEFAKVTLADEEFAYADFPLPSGAHIKCDEQALYVLFKSKYNVKEALKQHENVTEPRAPLSETMTPWSEEECRAFESGLRCYGKNFYMIKHNKVATRSVGEIIQFYYLWKKTERHDIFSNRYRIEKKRYALHPGTTDYMDRFLDEIDVSSNQNSGSGGHNVAHNHMLLGVTSHGQHSATSHGGRHAMSLNSRTSAPSGAYVSSHNSSLNAGGHGRTINVSTSGEPQTILINASDFPNSLDKPAVVITGNAPASSTSRNHHGGGGHSTSTSNTTTIVVGKNPIVIDGDWGSSSNSSNSQASSSASGTNYSTPSVSIYKIPSKGSNQYGHHR